MKSIFVFADLFKAEGSQSARPERHVARRGRIAAVCIAACLPFHAGADATAGEQKA